MPIERIGKVRESLTVNSEEFKKAFVRFLKARGHYSVKASSDVEGTFADIILTRKDEKREYWVEIKATTISLNNSDFLRQLAQYFAEYLRRTPENRFKFILACYKIVDFEYFQEIFDKLNPKLITELVNRMVDLSPPDIKSIIKKSSPKEWVVFFEEATVKEAELKGLEIGEAKVKPKAPIRPSIEEADYSAHVVTNFGEVSPLNEPDTLFLNIFEMILPLKIYSAKTPFESGQEILEDQQISFPAFDLTEKRIFTFEPFDKGNPLFDFTIAGTTSELELNDFLENEKNTLIVKRIINRWIKRQCRSIGLYMDDRTSAFYYPRKLDGNGVVSASWKPKSKKSTRELTKPMKREGKTYYWVHRAARIFVTNFCKKFYVQIKPRFLFSLDGLEILEGVEADTKDRFFRKSIYNRNLNQLYDVRFWVRHVFPETQNPETAQLTEFTTNKQKNLLKIGEQLSVECNYKPNIESETEVEELDMIESNTEQLIKLDNFIEDE